MKLNISIRYQLFTRRLCFRKVCQVLLSKQVYTYNVHGHIQFPAVFKLKENSDEKIGGKFLKIR